MIVKHLMRQDRILTLFSLIFLFIVACTNINPSNIADSCILFDEKKKTNLEMLQSL